MEHSFLHQNLIFYQKELSSFPFCEQNSVITHWAESQAHYCSQNWFRSTVLQPLKLHLNAGSSNISPRETKPKYSPMLFNNT